MKELINHQQFPDALLLFAVVQRFEFALKRGGFRQGERAEASWTKFGDAMPKDFFARVIKLEGVRILVEAPPAKLEFDGKELFWQAQNPPRNAVELMGTIRNVRNSLFHGEKRIERDRDQDLVAAALEVIDEGCKVSLDAYHQDETSPLGTFWKVMEGYSRPLALKGG